MTACRMPRSGGEKEMTRDTRKTICFAVCVAILLLATCFLAWGTSGFRNWDAATWFNHWGKGPTYVEPQIQPEDLTENTELVLTPNMNTAVKMRVMSAEGSDLQEASENTKVLRAQVEPNTGYIPQLNWTIAWSDGTGITAIVTDHVGMTVSEDTSEATLTYKKSFRRQIIVTVALVADEEIFGTCTVDCKQKFVSFVDSVEFAPSKLFPTATELTASTSAENPDIYTLSASSNTGLNNWLSYASTHKVIVNCDTMRSACSIPFDPAFSMKVSVLLNYDFCYSLDKYGFVHGNNSVDDSWAFPLVNGTEGNWQYLDNSTFPTADSLSVVRNSYVFTSTRGNFLNEVFCAAFPTMASNGVMNKDNQYFAPLCQAFSHFANNSTVAAENKFNFYLKYEIEVGGNTYEIIRKIFLNYTYPVDSLTVNPGTVVF